MSNLTDLCQYFVSNYFVVRLQKGGWANSMFYARFLLTQAKLLKSSLQFFRTVVFLSNFMADAHHAIKIVTRRTGLSAHVIRIWEKRYGAVKPERTGTNRRLYSEEQIERLDLLREITQAGHSIGLVAKLPIGRLRKLAAEASGGGGRFVHFHAPDFHTVVSGRGRRRREGVGFAATGGIAQARGSSARCPGLAATRGRAAGAGHRRILARRRHHGCT